MISNCEALSYPITLRLISSGASYYLVEQIKDLEFQLKRKLDEDEVGKRLLSIPCVGTLTTSTISTEIGDGKQYASSRDFAAATGLVPRQYSTGGRAGGRAGGQHCWASASGATKRYEPYWFSAPEYLYKNWNTSLASWPIGSGSYCVGIVTLS